MKLFSRSIDVATLLILSLLVLALYEGRSALLTAHQWLKARDL